MKICVWFEVKEIAINVQPESTFRDIYTQITQNFFCYSVDDIHEMFSNVYPNMDETLQSRSIGENHEFVIKTFY